MKIPAIRGKMGNWDYYATTLTFKQVNDYISRVDDELHKSKSLRDLIQRSITNNFVSIKKYVLEQPEFFFNSLVLAVYDDYPEWVEIEIKYEDFETYQIGLLNFSKKHKIFPIDGQHRVEGIKAALIENPELENMKISAIFVGHKNEGEGLKRTRRLFSTLNRYAKPVTMDDIIALDEDDSIAIITRNLLESNILFADKNISKNKGKGINNDDKHSFTSIITLYDCNKELLKSHRQFLKQNNPNKKRDKISLIEYLKFRPSEFDLISYEKYCLSFWDEFYEIFDFINDFVNDKSENSAEKYRNNITGGNLLFRPVGLLPFVQAIMEINKRKQTNFIDIFKSFKNFNYKINETPWKQVVWNDFGKSMIMGSQSLVKLLLIYNYDNTLLKDFEKTNLINKYSASINYQGENKEEVLKLIKF